MLLLAILNWNGYLVNADAPTAVGYQSAEAENWDLFSDILSDFKLCFLSNV